MNPIQELNFIYDRTQADVDLVKELNAIGYYNLTPEQKALYDTDLKGALNRSDLERIEHNLEVIASLLGVTLDNYDRMVLPDVINTDYIRSLLADVKRLRDVGVIFTFTPEIPQQPINHFEKWNDIEKILYDIHFLLRQRYEVNYYVGEAYTGEVIVGGNYVVQS